ncbi:MAG: carbohydrate binding domain-containing protein [Tannerellaceae bacterium]|jgi:hypothetical protein|nr:carbohydrate binding domain-containing protein [Tannerellaceae bacterium]
MKCFGFLQMLLLSALIGCRPELPPTSTITVDMESVGTPVNHGLYGLSLEGMERSDESGLYAELIRNQGFERGDSLPGWRPLSYGSYLRLNPFIPSSPSDPHSLIVSVYVSSQFRRGGVIAEGYEGIPIRKGEKYRLSFYMRTSTSVTPVPVQVALEDSAASRLLSRVYEVLPSYEWVRHSHTFTATEDTNSASLTFSIQQSSFFWIDRVSLLPEAAWKKGAHSLRPDLMEKIAALAPAFVLYPRANTEAGLQDYMQLCKDLQAEPLLEPAQGLPATWVHAWAMAGENKGTLRDAVAEACFFIRAENAPQDFERIAYTPLAAYAQEEHPAAPLISFNNHTSIVSPSYYLLQMFARGRGDALLKTEVSTYARPQLACSDSTHYESSALLTPAGEGEKVLLRAGRIHWSLGGGRSELYLCSGALKDSLAAQPFAFSGEQPARMVCSYDTVRCYIDRRLIHEAILPSMPSLVANATGDKQSQSILLKVVNTTFHNEISQINIRGASLDKQAQMLQLSGLPEGRNTFDQPRQVEPVEQTITLTTQGGAFQYAFPPHSITILRLTYR